MSSPSLSVLEVMALSLLAKDLIPVILRLVLNPSPSTAWGRALLWLEKGGVDVQGIRDLLAKDAEVIVEHEIDTLGGKGGPEA